MNLHSIASGITSNINPKILVTVKLNTGSITNPDGSRTPTFSYRQKIPADIQALSYSDIQFLDGLQLQGERRAIYLSGRLHGISRVRNTGGDLIVFPSIPMKPWPYGTTWLIALVVEQWPEWVKVAATLQNDVSITGFVGA